MVKRDLTPQKIIATYMTLATELGLTKVTFPRIAERLQIKPPSLYNHFKNLRDLQVQTAIQLHRALNQALTTALVGQAGEAALMTYALTYRQFAQTHAAVYELLNTVPSFHNAALTEAGHENTNLLSKILRPMVRDDRELLIASRSLRSLMHGYINLSQLGYFQKDVMTADESFQAVVTTYLAQLRRSSD
jgi:AcrR family transcriptional regulator